VLRNTTAALRTSRIRFTVGLSLELRIWELRIGNAIVSWQCETTTTGSQTFYFSEFVTR
jgi:hypothetical protein